MPIVGVAYAEIFTRDPRPWRLCLADVGYRTTGAYITAPDRRATEMQRGLSRVLLTEVYGGAPAEWLHRHGEGVADLAFLVTDAPAAFEQATAAGAERLTAPLAAPVYARNAGAAVATVGGAPGTGGLRHSLYQMPPIRPEISGLQAAIAVDAGGMAAAAGFYRRAFGFTAPELAAGPEPGRVVLSAGLVTVTLVNAGPAIPPASPGTGPGPAWWPAPPGAGRQVPGWN